MRADFKGFVKEAIFRNVVGEFLVEAFGFVIEDGLDGTNRWCHRVCRKASRGWCWWRCIGKLEFLICCGCIAVLEIVLGHATGVVVRPKGWAAPLTTSGRMVWGTTKITNLAEGTLGSTKRGAASIRGGFAAAKGGCAGVTTGG